MKHFGDITKIDGHDVPPVDVIVGGSPCQDLSIAGKREGFNGERSSLFLDQIRIIKEMHDECICLPFWEWLFSRIGKVVREYTDQPTMASLFDGIGGFPLVASRNGFRPVWASEIEEFPIAVTKYHFPEGEERKE